MVCNSVFSLCDLVDIKGGKRLPKGVSLVSSKNEHPYIRIRDLSEDKYVSLNDSFLYVDDETQKTISRYVVSSNDILVSIVGTIGLIAMVDKSLNGANLTENCVKLTNFKPNLVDKEFLYYYLISKKSKNEIKRSVVGAVQPKLPIKNIMSLPIDLPELSKQLLFVEKVKPFDEKIAVNNRIILNINEQINIIFKHLFPYHYNSDLPDGWKRKMMGEVTENIRERVNGKDAKVLSALNSGELALSEEYFTKQVFSKNINNYILVEPLDFAYNPARVNIGSIGINEFSFIGCVSPVYVVFRVESSYEYYFKEFIRTEYFRQQAITRSSGSVRQSMNYNDFALIELAYPPKKVIDSFNKIYIPLLKSRDNLIKENEKLLKLRNNIIDKLLSDMEK